MSTTNLDLYTSAEATARLMMKAPDLFAAEQAKLENFEATSQDRADWAKWQEFVVDRVSQYTALSKQDAPSTVAAKAAAAKALAAGSTGGTPAPLPGAAGSTGGTPAPLPGAAGSTGGTPAPLPGATGSTGGTPAPLAGATSAGVSVATA